MKRLLTWVIIFSLFIALPGCREQEPSRSVVFYYPRAEYTFAEADSVISSETRTVSENAGHEAVIFQYFHGPEDPALVSPFPAGTSMKAFDHTDSTLYITLSDAAADLTGIDLTLACSALAMTCMELTGAAAVQLSTETAMLDGEKSILIDSASVIFLEEFAANDATDGVQ